MRAWQIQSYGSVDGLVLGDVPDASLTAADSLIVRLKAVSLNFRDLTALRAPRPGNLSPLIPCSDGAGEVVAVGPAVTRWNVGDRVAGCFFQNWPAGAISREVMKSALGGPTHGLLCEFATLRESGVVAVPPHLSDPEAATLPLCRPDCLACARRARQPPRWRICASARHRRCQHLCAPIRTPRRGTRHHHFVERRKARPRPRPWRPRHPQLPADPRLGEEGV